MQKIITLLSFITLLWSGTAVAQTDDVNQRNKTLYDQTVDKVNFRTIEFVYDRKYPRKKFPASQSDFKSRKTFDDFEGNTAFKKLFLNYNDVAEKFKNKFGKGKFELATFEKALNDILINKDFEFFISSLNKDDKIQLIRGLQQINKKGIAQFVDASGKPRGFFSSDSVIDESSNPIVKSKNAEVATETEVTSVDTNKAVINTDATPEEVFQEKTPRRDWLTWLALILSVGALALAAAVKLKDIPELRSFVANNYQKRGESGAIISKATSSPETALDPAIKKQLDNLTREVEGLYTQMDELLHKNSVLEQKLAGSHPKPFDLPKTAYFEPETEAEPKNEAAETIQPAATNTPAPPVPATTMVIEEEEEPVGYKPFSLENNDAEQEEYIEETAELPEVTFFLAKPDRHGFFWNDEITRSFTPNRSLFELTLSGNDLRKGNFEIVMDAAQQKLAMENPDLYLKPVCEISGDPATGKRLETETPGTIILNADQWVIVKKARLKVIS